MISKRELVRKLYISEVISLEITYLILTFSLSVHNFVLCKKELLVALDIW